MTEPMSAIHELHDADYDEILSHAHRALATIRCIIDRITARRTANIDTFVAHLRDDLCDLDSSKENMLIYFEQIVGFTDGYNHAYAETTT